jgi:hypothetical protein
MTYTPVHYRQTRWQVLHGDVEVFAVSIDDEGCGRFLVVEDKLDHGFGLRINPDEWPALRDACEHALTYCHTDDAQPPPAKPAARMRLYTKCIQLVFVADITTRGYGLCDLYERCYRDDARPVFAGRVLFKPACARSAFAPSRAKTSAT